MKVCAKYQAVLEILLMWMPMKRGEDPRKGRRACFIALDVYLHRLGFHFECCRDAGHCLVAALAASQAPSSRFPRANRHQDEAQCSRNHLSRSVKTSPPARERSRLANFINTLPTISVLQRQLAGQWAATVQAGGEVVSATWKHAPPVYFASNGRSSPSVPVVAANACMLSSTPG